MGDYSQEEADRIQALLDAAQEVGREAMLAALRIAKERDLDAVEVVRVSGQQMQGMTIGLMGRRPPKPKPPKSPTGAE